MMQIREADEADKEAWDQLVDASEHGTIFHKWEWIKLMERHSIINKIGFETRGKLHPLLIEHGEKQLGLAPVYQFKHPLLNLIYSPPRSVEPIYLGPILNIPENTSNHRRQELHNRVAETLHHYLTGNLGAQLITIHTPPGFFDTRTYQWLNYRVHPAYTYFIDLQRGEKSVWEGFTGNVRSELRQCEAAGLEVKIGGESEYNQILSLLEERQRLRMTHEFFEDAYRVAHPHEMKVFYIEKDSKVISGVVLLHHRGRIYAWVGTPRSKYNGLPVNDLIYWESLKWGISEGFKTFEIMGADDQSLYPFKRKFGPALIQYYTMVWMTPTLSRILGTVKGYLTG